MGVSDLWGGGSVGATGSVLASIFDKPDTSEVVVSFLEFCPSLTVSGVVVESLRGRPLLRFGERGGFPSSVGEMGCGEVAATVLSVGGVLGGRPLFLLIGVTREFTLDSVEAEVASLPGGVSVFLAWFPPRPRPRCCCCSPS